MYKLSRGDTGLRCTENGLSYGGIALIAKAGNRFQPCQPEIDSIAKAGLAISPNGLQTIANFLNKGELGLAMIGALNLRLPDLEVMTMAKGYDPNEPRDDHGRWTSDGDGSNNTASTLPSGAQHADSGQMMSDASPAGPDTPAASVKGRSKLNIDAAVNYLNARADKNSGPKGKCAPYVEDALKQGGVDLPRPRDAIAAEKKGPILTGAGFVPVATQDSKDFIPQKGDVVVIQAKDGISKYGHMAMFNGTEWVSDYHQDEGTDPYPGSYYDDGTPPYVIYRP